MKKLLFVLLALCVATPAFAQDVGVKRSERKLWLDDVDGDAAAGLLTFTIVSSGGAQTKVQGGGYNLAVLHFYADRNATMSAVGLTCSSSDDGGTNLFVLQTCDVSSGDCTSSDASWTKAIVADKKWAWRVDITGYSYVSCVVTVTGGHSSEAITVSGYLTTK